LHLLCVQLADIDLPNRPTLPISNSSFYGLVNGSWRSSISTSHDHDTHNDIAANTVFAAKQINASTKANTELVLSLVAMRNAMDNNDTNAVLQYWNATYAPLLKSEPLPTKLDNKSIGLINTASSYAIRAASSLNQWSVAQSIWSSIDQWVNGRQSIAYITFIARLCSSSRYKAALQVLHRLNTNIFNQNIATPAITSVNATTANTSTNPYICSVSSLVCAYRPLLHHCAVTFNSKLALRLLQEFTDTVTQRLQHLQSSSSIATPKKRHSHIGGRVLYQYGLQSLLRFEGDGEREAIANADHIIAMMTSIATSSQPHRGNSRPAATTSLNENILRTLVDQRWCWSLPQLQRVYSLLTQSVLRPQVINDAIISVFMRAALRVQAGHIFQWMHSFQQMTTTPATATPPTTTSQPAVTSHDVKTGSLDRVLRHCINLPWHIRPYAALVSSSSTPTSIELSLPLNWNSARWRSSNISKIGNNNACKSAHLAGSLTLNTLIHDIARTLTQSTSVLSHNDGDNNETSESSSTSSMVSSSTLSMNQLLLLWKMLGEQWLTPDEQSHLSIMGVAAINGQHHLLWQCWQSLIDNHTVMPILSKSVTTKGMDDLIGGRERRRWFVTLLSCCAQLSGHHMHDALVLLQRSHYRSDISLYHVALRSLAAAQRFDECWSLISLMYQQRLPVAEATYSSILHQLHSITHIPVLSHILADMIVHSIPITRRTITIVTRLADRMTTDNVSPSSLSPSSRSNNEVTSSAAATAAAATTTTTTTTSEQTSKTIGMMGIDGSKIDKRGMAQLEAYMQRMFTTAIDINSSSSAPTSLPSSTSSSGTSSLRRAVISSLLSDISQRLHGI
jgi:hypothetical protein